MNINIENHSSFFRFSKKRKGIIIKSLEYVLRIEREKGLHRFKTFIRRNNINNIEINFLFIDDKEMLKYNKKYFNRNCYTDIIAFSMIEGIDIKNSSTLGDVVISVETAKINSALYKHSLED